MRSTRLSLPAVRCLIAVVILLCALPVARPALATCGGGGGGGRGGGGVGQSYKTTWKLENFQNVLIGARIDNVGVLLYFPAKGSSEHRFFKTKICDETSKECAFVKVRRGNDGAEAKAARAEYRPDPKRHVIHLLDWHGNSFKHYMRTDRTKFKGRPIRDTLKSMEKMARRLAKKLDRKVATAEKSVERSRWSAAIKPLRQVLAYKGYKAVHKAGELWATIEAAGDAELAAALKLEEKARKKQLTAIKRKFAGTGVERKAEVELGERPRAELRDGKDGNKAEDSQSRGHDGATMRALTEQTWRELLGGQDYDVLPPTAAERCEAALRAGLVAENAADYELARVKYAQAAGLDPHDAIPLVYLGELYRHHLGEWDEAEKMMRRVVELDNNDFAVAIALHAIGKMTIWGGDNEKGLALFRQSIERYPTSLCYRNLAVYWNSEGEPKKAFRFATRAFELDPHDSYNQVFYSVYLLMKGQKEQAQALMAKADFDPSMSYNYACFHAVQGRRDQALAYLRKHFYEYEQYDAVRSFEMAEARMDSFFKAWHADPAFVQLTILAGKTPWLDQR